MSRVPDPIEEYALGKGLLENLIPADPGRLESSFEEIFKDIGSPVLVQDPKPAPAPAPRLWDVEPQGVTHIAGGCIHLFGRYMRQRCDWCGIILIDYDLHRIAAPVGQDPTPGHWPIGGLVRVDGAMSALIDNPEVTDEGIQLPPDSCAFDPKTQVK